VTGEEEAIAALARTLDDLDQHLQVSDATAKRSERNRLSLLHVHAVFAVFIAPLFAAIGDTGMAAATFTVVRLIPAAPFSLAGLLFIGGVILGIATWQRHILGEIIGLWILMCWYATLSVSFAGAVFLWLADGLPKTSQPNLYPSVVYGHVCVVLAVHQATLLRIRRQRKQAR
jgi:hypothetical protein